MEKKTKGRSALIQLEYIYLTKTKVLQRPNQCMLYFWTAWGSGNSSMTSSKYKVDMDMVDTDNDYFFWGPYFLFQSLYSPSQLFPIQLVPTQDPQIWMNFLSFSKQGLPPALFWNLSGIFPGKYNKNTKNTLQIVFLDWKSNNFFFRKYWYRSISLTNFWKIAI